MDEIMPHIRLSREQAADYVLLPGDPQRLDRIAECLEEVEELAYNREYRSLRGILGDRRSVHHHSGGGAGENRCEGDDPDRKLRRFKKGDPAGGLNSRKRRRAG